MMKMFDGLKFYLENKNGRVFLSRNKKGDLELDELGKLILGGILLLILIFIVAYVIKGEFGNQEGNLKGIFGIFK
ncbi:MAG: hypothetical protein KC550_06820 [Nanoarchaeota archaeon]|nr:hypothetical protein [Nanoarchaeota archaeon]